jgi:glycosyltransferase involved in cell wall biosynthesis
MRYFAERGHEMHLISFAEMSPDDVLRFEKIGIKVHGSTGLVHFKKPWYTLRDLRFVRSVLRRERIDILHSHYLGTNAWYGALSRFHPHIITVMGADVTGPKWKPDQNIQSKVLTPFALRHADHITSWSRIMAEIVRPYCGPKTQIDVIHGGIHLERFQPGEKPTHLLERYRLTASEKLIFSPRLMRPLYNIDKIAEAFCTLRTNDPRIRLMIVAPEHIIDREYKENIAALLSKHGVEKAVNIIGPLDHSEIADHYRLADVTLSIPDIDGTPMSVLESMACGTPTVIGNLPDYDREYFENEKTTLMVDVKDPDAIAAAITCYFDNSELSRRITEEARSRVVASGGYEYQMEKMDTIYRQVLENVRRKTKGSA